MVRIRLHLNLDLVNGKVGIGSQLKSVLPRLRFASILEQALPRASLLQVSGPLPAPSWHLAGRHLHLCSSLISDC